MSAAAEIAIVTDEFPVLAAVIGTPELAAIGFLSVQRHTVAGFDERVNSFGVAGRNRGNDLSRHARRETVARKTFPRNTTVSRLEEPAAWSATLAPPRMNF